MKEKLSTLLQATGFKPGLHLVFVTHERYCPIKAGLGECSCDPDINLKSSAVAPDFLVTQVTLLHN